MPVIMLALLAALVPGVVNPAVTQENIGSTICVPGWAASVRPPRRYTFVLKVKQMRSFGLAGKPSAFEEDHLIPLSLGGHPTDPGNLWPQPWRGHANAHEKDRLENKLHRMVCSGQLPLDQAQREIAADWTASYLQRVGRLR